MLGTKGLNYNEVQSVQIAFVFDFTKPGQILLNTANYDVNSAINICLRL